jgi:predicted nuclease of predicted toxin-antitoxin system
MKLLFDQNLSPRLVASFAEEFPGSAHVQDLNLARATDLEVWTLARDEHYCIVSKDSDFADWAQVFGYPPALVWLRTGNCSTEELIAKLKKNQSSIQQLGTEGQPWILMVL